MSEFLAASPESCGVSSESILRFIDRIHMLPPGQEIHRFLFIRHGRLYAQGSLAPFDMSSPHKIFSVTKAFTSTAVGFAVQEGLFHLNDRIADFFPDKLPQQPQPEMLSMTVRDLLRMTAGQESVPVHHVRKGDYQAEDWAASFLSAPVIHQPGTVFGYNGYCSYMLSALITRVTGQDLMNYLDERLFRPLHISKPLCTRCPEGVCMGSTGIHLSLHDFAKLGLLYLNRGVWMGQSLLNAEWIDEATAKQIDTKDTLTGPDWSQGYCYHFWRGRHNTYRFCGAYGQMCVVMPDQDAIFAVQSGCDNEHIHLILDAFYDTVLSSMASAPLVENKTLNLLLDRCLRGLSLADPFSSVSPLARSIGRATYDFSDPSPIRRLSISFGEASCHVCATLSDGGSLQLTAGFAERLETDPQQILLSDIDIIEPGIYSASACFTELNTLKIKARLLNSPTLIHLTLVFVPGGVSCSFCTDRGKYTDHHFYDSIR